MPGSTLHLSYPIVLLTCRPWRVTRGKGPSRRNVGQSSGAKRNKRKRNVPPGSVHIKFLAWNIRQGFRFRRCTDQGLINGDDPKELRARATQIRHKVEGRKARAFDKKQVRHIDVGLSGPADRVQGRSGDTAAEGLQKELTHLGINDLQPCAPWYVALVRMYSRLQSYKLTLLRSSFIDH